MRKFLFLPFILLLFAVFTHAHADYWKSPSSATQHRSVEAACRDNNLSSTYTYDSFVVNSVDPVSLRNCIFSFQSNGNTIKQSMFSVSKFPSVCQPDEPRDADGVCQEPPPKCTAGEVVSSGLYDIGTIATNYVQQGICHRGCIVNFTGDSPVARSLVEGKYHYYARGQYEKIGESCSVPGDAPAGLGNTPTPTCGSGQTLTYGTGKPSCINTPGTGGADGTPANPHTPETPKPDDTTTEEKDPPVTNPDGSVSQTTRTTNPDGSTTTTTTTTNPDGSSSTTTTTSPAPTDPDKTEDPLKDFCKSNPNNKLCKETDERSWGRPDGVGKEFDIPTKDEEIEAKKDEFKLLLEQIRGEIEGLFNWNGAGGGGQLGCTGSVSILGANFQICLGQYSEQLSQIASGLVFLSLLIALFIILA